MHRLTLKEIHALELEMLDSVVAHCRANGIRYSLCGGSLLGAVRHNGFIPWDDDIDIMMPRDDYERFISTYSDSTGHFQLLSYATTPHYHAAYVKICDTRTTYETHYHRMGINIDIFAVDGTPAPDEAEAYIQHFIKLQERVICKRTPDFQSGHILKEVVKYLGKSILYPGTRHKYIERYEQFYNSHPLDSSAYGCTLGIFSHYGMRELMPAYVFLEYTELPFEGRMVSCTKHYHQYLNSLYGDYMQLPPEEQRNQRHYKEAYWK